MASTAPTGGGGGTTQADLQAQHEANKAEMMAMQQFQMQQQHDNQMMASRSNSQKADHDAMMQVAGNFK